MSSTFNSSKNRSELEYREQQLSNDVNHELEKAMKKIGADGRLKNIPNLVKRGIEFRENILELGAGGCWFASELSKFEKVKKIYALDFSTALLTRIAPLILMELHANSKKIKRIVGDFNELPFKERKFDFAVMDASLHHAVNPMQVLKEIKRVLKDNGKFLAIREPVLPLWRRRLKNIIGADERSKGITENIFTLSEWKSFFVHAGLRIKFISTYPTHAPKSWKIVKKPIRFLLIPLLNKYLFGYYYFLAEKEHK